MFRGTAPALTLALALCAAVPLASPGPAQAPTYGHSAIVVRRGEPVFQVDGAPFFVYGAAFFYERLPRDMWSPSLQRLRDLGINTLDLYVPWNWHELADGDFDFDGRTNPRRDLREVLRLAREFDFKIILRPGPVIRNEWRNGGYPAWLLARAEYGMPQHDLLEGRYPPTATLQNAHSDDAAAEWMRNATHLTYARRWLERVLHECAPVADRIVAVALDDDQGAYLDNQTYPAPHLAAYVRWLEGVVHGVTGPHVPAFINTYQMKVPASSPVWAMGNWYQSDAYALAEHDRAQLEFSTGLLHTRPAQPLMASEFQAGWLQAPGEVRPRAADPSNTQLALATMLGMGVRGVVLFPAQDTLAPSGWEAPFANAFYAWDAALQLDGTPSARAAPTAQVGALVTLLGPQLAAAAVTYDAAIAYLGGSFPPQRSPNALFGEIAAQTMAAQAACRDAGLACALVDPGALASRDLQRYPVLVVPRVRAGGLALSATVARALAAYTRGGGRLVAGVPSARALQATLRAAGRRPVVEGVAGATFAPDRSGTLAGFFTVANYGASDLDVPHASVALGSGERLALPRFRVAAHSALLAPVGVRLAKLDPRFAPGDVLAFSDCMPLGVSLANGVLAWRNTLGIAGVAVTSATRTCRIAARLHGKPYALAVGTAAGAGIRIDAQAMTYFSGAVGASSRATAALEQNAAFVPVRSDARLPAPGWRAVPNGRALAYRSDLYREGGDCIVLDNGVVRVVVSPAAGARAFVFEDVVTQRNVFTTVGALRDDVAVEPPLSTVDRIAKYTHDFAAGTFNRAYDADILGSGRRAVVRFTYEAPDVIPNGAAFARKLALEPQARAFSVEEGVDLHRTDPIRQRAVSVTSFSVGDGSGKTQYVLTPQAAPLRAGSSLHVGSGNALGFYDAATHELATLAWHAGDVEDAAISERRLSIVVRLTLAPGAVARMRYGYEFAASLDAAGSVMDAADHAAQRPAQGAYNAARTTPTTTEGKWRNGLRDRLKSD